MAENYFDHLPSKEELNELGNDSNDPRSNNYNRVLVYPKIKVVSVLLNIFGYAFFITGLVFLLWCLTSNIYLTVFIPLGISIIYFLIRLGSIVIFIVECYQILAPTKLRMKCRFEPSCSEYMILSIKKYGAYRGIAKGIKRLKRCKFPNGGYDYP